MANKYPYVASAGPLLKTIEHLRRSFPKELTAETLRKLGLAPKNESYVINVLRFIGVIDEEGRKVEDTARVFLQHKDNAFAEAFQDLVGSAYSELFELHGEGAWTLDKASLTQFFRTTDHTTEVVGKRQAGTFTYLSGLAGHSELPAIRDSARAPSTAKGKKDVAKSGKKATARSRAPKSDAVVEPQTSSRNLGLTVRVEVNLPAEGDQATYDRIFRSIRKNLIDVE